jgi:hypothetical protein
MTLDSALRRLRRRLGRLVLLDRLAVCLMWASIVAIGVAALDRLIYLGVNLYATGGVLILAGALVAVVWGVRRAPTRLQAARAADRRLGLGDRTVSAVQLGASDGPWATAVGQDAAAQLQGVRASDVFPLAATWPTRLLLPLVVVFNLIAILPSFDLLGRMGNQVERLVMDGAEARAVSRTVAAASGGDGPAADKAGPLTKLRIKIAHVRKGLADGVLDAPRRVALGEELARLAEEMHTAGSSDALKDAMRQGSEALKKGDPDASDLLRRVEVELARLEEALRKARSLSGEMKVRADTMRAALPTVASAGGPSRSPQGVPDDGGLVELAPRAREGTADGPPLTGIMYSQARGSASDEGEAAYGRAARAATAQIESGTIPPGHVELVRSYFTAIKPIKP